MATLAKGVSMAWLPMPGAPGDSFMQGINTGSGMFQRLMQPILHREDASRQWAQHQGNLALQQRAQSMREQMMPYQQALMEAQTQRAIQGPSLHPSGDVANALYVEQLRSTYGENDPRYLQAKAAHDTTLSGRQSLVDYRGALSQTAPWRAMSTLGKLIAEGRGEGALDVSMGREPVVDDQRAQAYEQAIAKQVTDTDARKRLLFATNIDKTLENIPKDDLFTYSGIKNIAEFAEDFARAAVGEPTERFLRYQNAVEAAVLLADQMRQFYGDSIQPQNMERLRALANPETWWKDPKVAKSQFETLTRILQQETETYKQMGRSPISLRSASQKPSGELVYNPATGEFE
jgi:hypothetical protein